MNEKCGITCTCLGHGAAEEGEDAGAAGGVPDERHPVRVAPEGPDVFLGLRERCTGEEQVVRIFPSLSTSSFRRLAEKSRKQRRTCTHPSAAIWSTRP